MKGESEEENKSIPTVTLAHTRLLAVHSKGPLYYTSTGRVESGTLPPFPRDMWYYTSCMERAMSKQLRKKS